MNTATRMKIKMLPANEGDCIFIEAGRNPTVRILIDTGPASTWPEIETVLRENISENAPLDLLVITHIDSDHIGGATKILEDPIKYPLKEIWFNGLQQVFELKIPSTQTDVSVGKGPSSFIPQSPAYSQDGTYNISFRQSAGVSSLLEERGDIWNSIFGSHAVLSNIGEKIALSEEVSITILLPTKKNLLDLLQSFEVELRKWKASARVQNSPEIREAFERFCNQYRIPLSETKDIGATNAFNIEALMEKSSPLDRSITNASSISFVLEVCGCKALFLGDAPSQYAIPALKEWSKKTGEPLFFDVVKLPHHGSKQNCIELLKEIRSSYFLISTDGKKHGHPSPETIALIVGQFPEGKEIVFNYRHNTGVAFLQERWMEQYHYGISFCSEIEI